MKKNAKARSNPVAKNLHNVHMPQVIQNKKKDYKQEDFEDHYGEEEDHPEDGYGV